MDLQQLKDMVAKTLDVVEFLDILDLDMFDLVELLEEQIQEKSVELEQAIE